MKHIPEEHGHDVIVLGGSRGLGAAIVRKYLGRGCSVRSMARTVAAFDCSGSLKQDVTDLAVARSWEELLPRTKPGRLFVCSAVAQFGRPSNDLAKWEAVVATNVTGTIALLDWAVHGLAAGSSIAWVASLSAIAVEPKWAGYAATKAAVIHYLRCMRGEAEKRGVSITLCFPGPMTTRFHADAGAPRPAIVSDVDDVAQALIAAVEARSRVWAHPLDQSAVSLWEGNRDREEAATRLH